MSKSCKGLITDFVKCIMESECYRSGGTLDGCKLKVVKENQECEALRQGVFACRRGQLDARNRIRGNKGY